MAQRGRSQRLQLPPLRSTDCNRSETRTDAVVVVAAVVVAGVVVVVLLVVVAVGWVLVA